MSKIMGTVRNGKIEPDEPIDWPNGHRVVIADAKSASGSDVEFLNEDEWPDTPENRAELLRRLEAIEPLGWTPEEEARINLAREEFKRVDIESVRRQMGLDK